MLTAERILELGEVPGPPVGEVTNHPLAVDINGDFGAVSWASWNPYPRIEVTWWADAITYRRGPQGWGEVTAGYDNTTSPRPFERPRPGDDGHDLSWWTYWESHGGTSTWEGVYPDMYSFFGIAPIGTERLTIENDAGEVRDLRITPWNGAFVAVVEGAYHWLRGYDADGRLVGERRDSH